MFRKTKPNGTVTRIIVAILILLMLAWSFFYFIMA